MAISYDLVIMGGTPEGFYAAEQATQQGARVALIRQGGEGRRSYLYTRGMFQSLRDGLTVPAETGLSPWQWMTQRATWIAETLTSEDWQRLMVKGCDVIDEKGRVTGDRPLTIETPLRKLTARALLLATGSGFQQPPLVGLEAVPHDTPEAFLKRTVLPDSVVILGNSPSGLALSQLLARWGVATALVSPNASLLGPEDPAVANWLMAQLQADGVDLRLGAAVSEFAIAGAKTMVKLADATLTTDMLVMATHPVPQLRDMGLERWLPTDRPLAVNAFLQTTHPRIFACGAVLGGYEMPAIAHQEAQIAVSNALFWNRQRIDYRALTYELPTQPPMARVGLTEPQARQRYGAAELLVAQQPWYHHPKAQWWEATTGFCKLIAHQDGQILGVHGVGPEASEWVQTAAWMMAQKVAWWQLAQQPALPDSFLAVLQQAAQQWERDRWRPGQWRRNWSENWFNWRRSR